MENLPENTSPPSSPPITQPASTQPPPEPPKESLQLPKWLIILFISTALLFLSLASWWVYSRLFQGQTVPTQETDRPFTLNTENQNANGWTDYTSQKCRYQISYPLNWHIYTQAEQEEAGTVLIASSPVQSETVTTNEIRIQIGCSDIDRSISIQTAVDSLNARYQGKNITLSQIKPTTVGGKTAYYQTITPSQGNPSEEYYIFPTPSRVIIVNITTTNSTQVEVTKTIIQKLTFSN